jgi:hypothetical protein
MFSSSLDLLGRFSKSGTKPLSGKSIYCNVFKNGSFKSCFTVKSKDFENLTDTLSAESEPSWYIRNHVKQ